MTYLDFFLRATDRSPYEYQTRLADSRTCESRVIQIPTGLGKTAAVVLAWLWNRVCHPDEQRRGEWPRRLVYCLPMRTVVEQTRENVAEWLQRLWETRAELGLSNSAIEQLAWLSGEGDRKNARSPVILMGGEELEDAKREWDIYPESPAIIIGTQDMLLSRALNRGYGMSRYRWPMHFALLNNDCLWVVDETQLMGVGVETSAQMEGFRRNENWPAPGVTATWWMSATLDELRLATVDHPKPDAGWPTEELSESEKSSGRPHELITAKKSLSVAPFALNPASKGTYARQLAELTRARHQEGSLTLVVVNRVSRARQVFEALTGGKKPLYAAEKVGLIHSRFRPIDRERHTRLLFQDGDRIIIATQAVEAGVDVSARLLITELAPWSSFVQRVGRCNRRAEFPNAEVIWADVQPKDEKDDLLLPYAKDELERARGALGELTSASLLVLRQVVVREQPQVRPVIRRRDLVDLFDTTPDICGLDLDISRYIRDGADSDVQFYWRAIQGDWPEEDEPDPLRQELCRVSIAEARAFLKKATSSKRVWGWNPLKEAWEVAGHPRPGGVYLVDAASGGYSDSQGWTGDPKDTPTPYPPPSVDGKESYRKDPDTFSRFWQTLDVHTAHVCRTTDALTAALPTDERYKTVLRTAAFWHDLGKAHEEFQRMLHGGDASRVGTLWAKSAAKASKCRRYGFRHELASALAWLVKGPAEAAERDLVAYLIAAHHGKVRLSIRSVPGEEGDPSNPEGLFARGIWEGDKLPPVALGDLVLPEAELDLSFMKMGEGPNGPSWLARSVGLRDRFGPFFLAYLETILRSADGRASMLA